MACIKGRKARSTMAKDKAPNNLRRKGRKVRGQDGRASMDNVCPEPKVTREDWIAILKARYNR